MGRREKEEESRSHSSQAIATGEHAGPPNEANDKTVNDLDKAIFFEYNNMNLYFWAMEDVRVESCLGYISVWAQGK